TRKRPANHVIDMRCRLAARPILWEKPHACTFICASADFELVDPRNYPTHHESVQALLKSLVLIEESSGGAGESFVRPALPGQGQPEVLVGAGVVGAKAQGLAVAGHGLLELALLGKDDAQVVERLCITGLE